MHWLYSLIDGLIARPPTLVPIETRKRLVVIAVPGTRIGYLVNPPQMPTD